LYLIYEAIQGSTIRRIGHREWVNNETKCNLRVVKLSDFHEGIQVIMRKKNSLVETLFYFWSHRNEL